MAMATGSGSGPRSEMNVTPLVDVVLVLLIIFMVVTPVLRVGRDVSIPPVVRAKPLAPPAVQLVVGIAADGALFINSEQVAPGAFTARLRQALDGRGDRPTFVAAADSVPYQRVVRLMDLCRDAGAANLAIVVEDLTAR